MGDPTKLITKPIEGIVNAVGSVAKTGVSATGETLSAAVGQVGDIMSQPGAGAALAGVGAAFGLPTGPLMGLASGFMGQGQASVPEATANAQPQSIVIPSQPAEENDLGMIAMIGGGVLALVLVIVLLNKGKK